MDPRIEYTTTPDGVSLAYVELGKGVPLLIPPPASPWSHIRRELEIPEWLHWYEHLGEFTRIIRYDNRGAGSSDRDVTSLTADEELIDLEAIAEKFGDEPFALFAVYYAAIPAIRYAVKHPERVSHLILWCGFAKNEEVRADPTSDAIRRLLDSDYVLFTETLCLRVFGWGAGEPAHRVAELMREAMVPDLVKSHWDAHQDIDITELLPKVACPTLVIHRREFQMPPTSAARALAAAIPNSTLRVFDGASLSPYVGQIAESLGVIAQFLGSDWQPEEAFHTGSSAGFRTIMFTDIHDSTATTQAIGDDRAQEMIRTHNDIVRRALHRFAGEEVKHTGDGIMASFTSAVAGLECSIAIQRALAAHSALNAGHPPFAVRIGINAGEPLIENGDLFGTAVQVASRICTRAEPRQIMVSDVMRQLVAGKGFLFADQGESELRGFEDPVRLFELRWNESGT